MKKALVVLVVTVMLLALSTPVFAFGKGGLPGAHDFDNMRSASELRGATAGHVLEKLGF